MTDSADIDENSLAESLDRVNRYLGRLQQLPSESTLKNTIEADLWRTVTKQSDPPPEVKYSELPDISHSLIGKVERDGEESDPWWLREFDWKAEFGGEELTLRGEAINSFAENFDRNRTVIKKPRFSGQKHYNTQHRTLLFTHETLQQIRSELEKYIDADGSDSSFELPETLFQIQEGQVVLTESFDEWIASFLQLLPAFGSEATALYLANTRTSKAAAESVLDEQLFNHLDRLGIVQEHGYNDTYVDEYNNILHSSSIANRTIPSDAENELYGLQYQLYRGFLGTFEPTNDYTVSLFENATKRTPAELDTGELGLFTRIACGSPAILSKGKYPKLMSLQTYAKTTGESGYMNSQYRTVRRLFEESDWFE